MADLEIRVKGTVGHVVLNRPEALNALTHQMCLELETALRQWEIDPTISLILIEGAGDRAFCAGGDINKLYAEGRAGNHEYGRQFWRDEYRLNALIANYKKPYVALMDGIVMGGGVGVSMHGSHRIVTDRTLFAMPECSIGLIPDVGGSYLLANAPGRSGEYLGLTGTRLKASDCLYSHLADYYIKDDDINSAWQAVLETGNADILAKFASDAPEGELKNQQRSIDAVFALETVQDIEHALQTSTEGWAQKTLKNLRKAAPLSALVALKVIRKARKNGSIEAALGEEYRFVSRCGEHSEFLEGIRAAVIDKDRNPNWAHKSFDAVPNDLVALMTSPTEGGELVL